ncbi:hypothetical protein U1Q18_026280 [Sarracenia purpurea var. burkii]
MAEGLSSNFYNHFLALLWGDGDSAYLSEADASVYSEWESYSSIIKRMCTKSGTLQRFSDSISCSSWDFLVNSKFHKNYCKTYIISGISTAMSHEVQGPDSPESYLDGAQTQENLFYPELMMEILDALHAVYESLKLNNLRKKYLHSLNRYFLNDILLASSLASEGLDLGRLVVLLCHIAYFLGEESYLDHYIRDFPDLSEKFGMQTSFSGRTPPSLFRWLENCLQHGCNSADRPDISPLICKDESSVLSWARKIISFYSLLCGAEQLGKNLSSGVRCNITTGSSCNYEELTVLAMVGERFGLQELDLLPVGVSLPLRHALDKCRESPPTDWPAAAYVLLGREDMALSRLSHSRKSKELEPQTNVNFVSMSTPYMLHVHPVTIPSSISDTIGLENTKFDDGDSVDGSMSDGMEHIFNSTTQLRYGRDLRLNEVRHGQLY